MSPEERRALVIKISLAMAAGKDSGGYDTLLDMYAHTALTVIEDEGIIRDYGTEKYDEGYTNGWEDGNRSARHNIKFGNE